MRRVRLVAGQPQRHVGLDGGGQVGGAAEEVGPGAVLALLGPDPARRGGGGRVVAHAEELAQQQVLGVHGHVGLELALPPALGALQPERVVPRPGQGLARASARSPPPGELPLARRDELGDRGQLGPDAGGQVDVGQAGVGRGQLGVGLGLGPLLAARRDHQVGGADQVVLAQRLAGR